MHMFSQGEALLRRPRHRRRAGAARHRPRLRQPLPRRRQRLRRLFRRRRGQPGPGLRELQHGGAVEAAGRLRDREQPLRAWAPRSTRSSAQTDLSKPRRRVQHSRRCRSTAWTCARCKAAAEQRARMVPRAARARSSSKCRPIAIAATRCPIRPSTAPRRKCRRCATSTTRSSRSASACSKEHGVDEDELKAIDAKVRAVVDRSGRLRHSTIPSPIRPSSGPTSCSDAGDQDDTDGHERSDARAVADDGAGQARQMAEEGRRRGQVRRRPRRDRDRQGDDGGRGGRRRHARRDPGRRRHRQRRGQHADRA